MDAIIQIWKGDNNEWGPYLARAVEEGYNVILSTPWYLNYISYGKYNTNESVMNLEFFKYYQVEPLMNFTGSMFYAINYCSLFHLTCCRYGC